jgi:RecB family endonuclease NucS
VERNVNGTLERVVFEVKLTCKIMPDHITQLKRYVKNLAGGKAKIVNKILVVPSGANTDAVL